MEKENKYNLSIVIPTLNEEENIIFLIERIHNTFSESKIKYEVIFVDDHSTDATREIIEDISKDYPVRLFLKEGQKGKAQSLLEGFKYCKYNLISILDADLQYPPEALVPMIDMIIGGKDVVVANRKTVNTKFSRKILSRTYRNIFGKFLNNIDLDVQSGLKVFRSEIIKRIKLNPTQWAFDLEFLVKAKNAGYSLSEYDIDFDERKFGTSKVNPVKTGIEIAMAALKIKFTPSEPAIFHDEMLELEGSGFHYKGNKFIPHNTLSHKNIALYRLSRNQKLILGFMGVVLVIALLLNWHKTLVIIIAALTIVYFCDLLFNLFLIFRSFSKENEIVVSEQELLQNEKRDWPMYTIFCPLYKEWEVLPQFVTAMSKLDYPKEKLQVMLLLEEDDKTTIEKARSFDLPFYFDIVVVPHSLPKTKPKACNYGLLHAKGEYIVIYDAEDVPDNDQLKKAIIAFEKTEDRVVCMQAKLNFYNPRQNIITRAFTAEYSLWFDLVLTGLQSIGAPIPLGGTSNHFRKKDLLFLNGWDAFNVTEDCDLGMRLAKLGFKTAIIESQTLEEANSQVENWFYQRSRWIKGYMQTYLVHMRNPQKFFRRNWKEPHFITFQLVVGGKIASMFINPIMWLITIIYFTMRARFGVFIESFYPTPILYMGVLSFVFGNFLYLYYYMIGCAKREHYDIIKYAFLVPFYWLAMSAAAWKAVYELIKRPHHWAKTKHGLHLNSKNAMKQSTNILGRDLVDNSIAK